MKILHINTYSTSGACIAATRFHLQLLEMGIESNMLFLHLRGYDIPKVIEYRKSEELPDTFLTNQKLRLRNLFCSKKLSQFEINEQKVKNQPKGFEKFSFATADADITTQKAYKEADIIHLHWTGTFIDFSFFQKNNKPVVWTLHDMNAFTGGCHYSNGCKKYIANCNDCPQLQGTIDSNNAYIDQLYKIEKLEKKQIHIISPSLWLLKCAKSSNVFSKMEGTAIFNCLDLDIFKPYNKAFCKSIFNLPSDKKILLFVSDTIDNKRKGFDLLLETVKNIDSKLFHLCIIGKNNDATNSLQNCTFLGKIRDERLLALAYNTADAFILPSREDNLPNVMLESLACGVPVIAFAVGGMKDVINHGKNGLLASELSVESLSKQLSDYLENNYSLDNEYIRNYAMEFFSPRTQAQKYIEVYKSVLKQ